eukprot:scaffold26978_cov19-Tisochrysis_lutea.AAC.1
MLLEKLGIAIQQGYPAPCLVYPYAGCLAAKRAQDESGLLHFGPCPSDIRCRLGGQQQQQQPVAGQSRHTQPLSWRLRMTCYLAPAQTIDSCSTLCIPRVCKV